MTLFNAIFKLQVTCHDANKRWWQDPKTGKPISPETPYLVPAKIMMIVTELAESVEGHRRGAMDSHLTMRPSLEVELADALIRILDLAGALNLDLAGAVVERLAYNAVRPDHAHKARTADGGKAY